MTLGLEFFIFCPHKEVDVTTYKNYREYKEQDQTQPGPKLPLELQHLSVFYDGGRLQILINGEEVYKNLSAGDDFNVTME